MRAVVFAEQAEQRLPDFRTLPLQGVGVLSLADRAGWAAPQSSPSGGASYVSEANCRWPSAPPAKMNLQVKFLIWLALLDETAKSEGPFACNAGWRLQHGRGSAEGAAHRGAAHVREADCCG